MPFCNNLELNMISRMCKMMAVAASFLAVFLIWWIVEPDLGEEEKTVCINEICNNNFSTVPICGHEDDDWIELYNDSEKSVSLEGWTISDSEEDLQKYALPEMTLKSGEFIVLYANGEDVISENNVFLNFRLSQGENIYLCDSDGKLMDSVNIPDLKVNTSYARVTDGLEEWQSKYPTFQSTNNGSKMVQTKQVEVPVFSLEGGFYTGSNLLELSVEDEDCAIYYTTDGSTPTEDSMWYVEPILIENRSDEPNCISDIKRVSTSESRQYGPDGPVDKITVIRAVAIDPEGNRSDVVTHSYIVDIHEDSTYKNLPIVSLVTNPDDFFNPETGLYVVGAEYERQHLAAEETGEDVTIEPNYKKSGKSSEREGNIEIYNADKTPLLKQKVGMRIHGESTRLLPQKSFSIYAREMYGGKDVFDANVFGDNIVTHKFLLSTGYDASKVRHQLHSQLLDDLKVDTQKFIRCNVFLNGEYWGVYWIAEVYDERFIENYYGIPKEEVIVEESAWPQELIEITENKDNLSNDELYKALAEKIDIQSCIDHYASMIYINHDDWFVHNTYMWRSSTVSESNLFQDGKWRWMVYDTEGADKNYEANTFIEGKNRTWADDPIINTLMLDEEFCRRFVVSFMDLANTVFKIDNVANEVESVYASFKPAVEAHAMRWDSEWADEMDEKVDKINTFYENRLGYITQYMKEEFKLKGEVVPVTLDISDTEKGNVIINTVTVEWNDNSWQGSYFTDYPITLAAKENEGSDFVGWYDESGSLVSEEKEIAITLKEENYYKAVFEADGAMK